MKVRGAIIRILARSGAAGRRAPTGTAQAVTLPFGILNMIVKISGAAPARRFCKNRYFACP